ncbi:unnamed protein product (macronuclear) [Paramecium tetraurelia]|uniref:Uncharacterized protein n=1 Tax=Paramecium tetraurelia TaxID=5888 RepID=A0BRI4_PARTE|nr:uncharacterized protein GSPATT00031382001 [Paramecium tetraurelia]CAK61151.1 unnamed protein product [Paramecium tetraurelia]|eukprot:XP_001428549.1 hypothetical protein (macronuclear) [Paramecium tetraurelia strain d4-2]
MLRFQINLRMIISLLSYTKTEASKCKLYGSICITISNASTDYIKITGLLKLQHMTFATLITQDAVQLEQGVLVFKISLMLRIRNFPLVVINQQLVYEYQVQMLILLCCCFICQNM